MLRLKRICPPRPAVQGCGARCARCLGSAALAALIALGIAPLIRAEEPATLLARRSPAGDPRRDAAGPALAARPLLFEPELALGGGSPEPPPLCDDTLQDNVRLSGTLYNERRPERSLAILSNVAGSKGTAVYRGGAQIGSVTLMGVYPRAVLLGLADGRTCWLRIESAGSGRARPRHAARPPVTRSRSRRTAFSKEELQQSIHKLNANSYRVDRSLVNQALGRAMTIARSTRLRPVQHSGRTVGMVVRRMARDGLLSHLGVRRGDVLKTLNGLSVASVDDMLSARARLGSASRLSLSLLRGGRPVTLEYHVQ